MLDKISKGLSKIWSLFTSCFSRDMAIDLGTANTLVFTKEDGIILNEPSVVAVEVNLESLTPFIFGAGAKEMIGKNPSRYRPIRPLKDGVIADFKISEAMIRHFVKTVFKSHFFFSFFFRPKIIICVPSGSTSVERRAIQDAAEGAGAKTVFLIEEPMAAAIGAGLPVHDATGSMIVDIGGGTTEIAIIALGGVVYGTSIKVGGDKLDEAIMHYIKKEFNVLIGESTAEWIKKNIASAKVEGISKENFILVKGRDLINGVPKQIAVTQLQIAEAIEDYVGQIIEEIRRVLENSPPELSSDIIDRGITLTGGGAMLPNLDKAITGATGLHVNVADDPLDCVVKGTGFVLTHFDKYRHLTFRQE